LNSDGHVDLVVGQSGEPLGGPQSSAGLEVFLGRGDRTFAVFRILEETSVRGVLVEQVDLDVEPEIVYTTPRSLSFFDPSHFPSP
jgi:hypothetical protein